MRGSTLKDKADIGQDLLRFSTSLVSGGRRGQAFHIRPPLSDSGSESFHVWLERNKWKKGTQMFKTCGICSETQAGLSFVIFKVVDIA